MYKIYGHFVDEPDRVTVWTAPVDTIEEAKVFAIGRLSKHFQWHGVTLEQSFPTTYTVKHYHVDIGFLDIKPV